MLFKPSGPWHPVTVAPVNLCQFSLDDNLLKNSNILLTSIFPRVGSMKPGAAQESRAHVFLRPTHECRAKDDRRRVSRGYEHNLSPVLSGLFLTILIETKAQLWPHLGASAGPLCCMPALRLDPGFRLAQQLAAAVLNECRQNP